MRRPLLVALPVALFVLALAAACARNRQADTPRPLDPVGRIEYTSESDGQPVRGTITITGAPGAYQAVMTTGGLTRDLFFQNVTVSGDRVTMLAQTPTQNISVHLTIAGNAISGDWAMGPRTGALRGTRQSGGGGR
jgi:hypothetical protein